MERGEYGEHNGAIAAEHEDAITPSKQWEESIGEFDEGLSCLFEVLGKRVFAVGPPHLARQIPVIMDFESRRGQRLDQASLAQRSRC
jgi:hypothetical protein